MNPLVEVIVVERICIHPNADSLELIDPDNSGMSWAIVKKGEFKVGDTALYFDAVNEPMVPISREEFAMLAPRAKANQSHCRIKAMNLRGVRSRGLVIPYKEEYGTTPDEIISRLDIKKWEAPLNGYAGGRLQPGLMRNGPDHLLHASKYDIAGLGESKKSRASLGKGTEIIVTEKVHGAHFICGWLEGVNGLEFMVRSRNTWKKEEGGGTWWAAANKYALKEKLSSFPHLVLHGEVLGVQDLHYGFKEDVGLLIFDIWDSSTREWFSWDEVLDFCIKADIPTVPELARLDWSSTDGKIPVEIQEMAEGPSQVNGAKHIREGVVCRTPDRTTIFKVVGQGYLTRKTS